MAKRLLFVLLIIVILVTASIILYLNFKQPTLVKPTITFSPTATTTPTSYQIPKDLPPLYPGVKWGEPKFMDKIIFRDSSDELIEKVGVYLSSAPQSTYDKGYFSYYISSLKSLSWSENSTAGGPEGELYHFQRKDKYLNVGYRVTRDKPGPEGRVTSYQYYIQYSQ